MRQAGLEGVRRGRKRDAPRSPTSSASRPTDLVDRDFTADAPRTACGSPISPTSTTWIGRGLCRLRDRRVQPPDRRLEGRHHDAAPAWCSTRWRWRSGAVRPRRASRSPTGMIYHNDAGSQYTSFAFTSRLVDAGIDPSVGSGRRCATTMRWPRPRSGCSRPRRSTAKGRGSTLADVELATLEWVDWYNTTPACTPPAAESRPRSTRPTTPTNLENQ